MKYAHTNLIARDWQRLASFYETVFGCIRVPPERHLADESIARGSGVAGARIDGVHLRLPGFGSDGPTLEVFQYGEVVDAPAPPANRVGFGHIAMTVDDVRAAREAVLAAGGSTVGEVVDVTIADGTAITWSYVRDPEGNIVELQRRGPAASTDVVVAVPARTGHFVLESGYHTDQWLTLDLLFADPERVEPAVTLLAERLRRHTFTAICGPFTGGAFLAQSLAMKLSRAFYYAEPERALPERTLFAATYRLTPATQRAVRGQRIAVVDDMISAGSSVRATIAAIEAAGATPVVVACLATLGEEGQRYFAARGLPVETLTTRSLALWKPELCPLCARGMAMEDPTSSPPKV